MSKINGYADGLNIVDMTVMECDDEIDMETGIVYGGGTRNYRDLINLPTINGTILYDNYNEIDPTVPDWAKAPEKPTYTANEVGALPRDTKIPENTSDLNNDSGFVSDPDYIHTDNNFTDELNEKLTGIEVMSYDDTMAELNKEA